MENLPYVVEQNFVPSDISSYGLGFISGSLLTLALSWYIFDNNYNANITKANLMNDNIVDKLNNNYNTNLTKANLMNDNIVDKLIHQK